jgi:ribosomal protein L7/L12
VYTRPNVIIVISFQLNGSAQSLTYKDASGKDKTYIKEIVKGNNDPKFALVSVGGNANGQIEQTPADWGIEVLPRPTLPPKPTPPPLPLQCITSDEPLAINKDKRIPMKTNNTAFLYVPKEMFETNASYFYYEPYPAKSQYVNYIYGFWGFIQVSGNQIFAYDNKKDLSSVPKYQINVEATTGSSFTDGRGALGGYQDDVSYGKSLFKQPQGLAYWKDGKKGDKYIMPFIFVSDTDNHCIRMINTTIYMVPGSDQPRTYGVTTLKLLDNKTLSSPTGLDFDSNGVLYVADTGSNTVKKITIGKINKPDINTIDITDILNNFNNLSATVETLVIPDLNTPRAVMFNSSMLYVSDQSRIYRIHVFNKYLVDIIATGLSVPYSLVFKEGKLLFSATDGVKILEGNGVVTPIPNADFTNKRPLALIEYDGNIVVGLKDAKAVQIRGDCIPTQTSFNTTPPPTQETSFNVFLASPGPHYINVIKEIRAIVGLDIKSAKNLVLSAPTPVKVGVSKEEAENIKRLLEGAGATVEIKPPLP